MRSFKHFELYYYPEKETLYWSMKKHGFPNLCYEGLEEFLEFVDYIKSYFNDPLHPLKYFVTISEHKGIFSLGGDLPFFIDNIKSRQFGILKDYAHLAVKALHAIYSSFDLPIITVALVQGKAYGGGVEMALAHDHIIASHEAQFALPESKFNLFPGMGAYSLLQRKLTYLETEEILTNDKVMSSNFLQKKGLITQLDSEKNNDEVIMRFINECLKGFNFELFHQKSMKSVNHISLKELTNITNIWVDATKGVSNQDIRKMEAFSKAQSRIVAPVTA